MNFRGQLLLPNETGPGLRVRLDVADHHLAVESDDGGLGAWPLEVVDVRRLQGDVFAMTVAGEDLHFVADDALSFAYTGLPAIKRVSKVRSRSPLRSWLAKVWGESPQKAPGTGAVSALGEPLVDLVELSNVDTDEIARVEAPSAFTHEEPETWAPTTEDDPFRIEPWLIPEEGEGETARCRGVRADGEPCRSPIVNSAGYCGAHDPRRSIAQGYRAALEARARLKKDSTARLNRIYTRLDKAMRQVERGELDPEVAMAMAQLARTMCAILDLDEHTV